MNDDLTCLATELDAFVTPLLMAARIKKEVDANALAKMRQIIAAISKAYEGRDAVPKKLVGSLYFVVFSLLAEADHAKDPEELSLAAWTIQEDLRKVFGPKL
jgi:hypothetical protein